MNLYQFFNSKNESILIISINHQTALEYANRKGFEYARFVGKIKTEQTNTRELKIA